MFKQRWLSYIGCIIIFGGTVGAIEPPALPQGFLLDKDVVIREAASLVRGDYPDADRILLNNRVLEQYAKDGTATVWDDEWVLVLTEKGRRDATTTHLGFNASYSRIFVYAAEIIKPDGRVVTVDTQRYTRVMTDSGQMGANIYDPNNKVLVLSLPELEIGDLCHIVTTRDNFKTRMPNTWSDYTIFEYTLPIIKADYMISAPPELPIRHKVLREPVGSSVTEHVQQQSDGRMLYHWEVRNVPQMFPEPDMPPLYTQVQRLLMSTIEDWQSVSQWYWELCHKPLSATTPQMETKVRELCEGTEDRDEKIRRLFRFVSQQIRYMGITPEDTAPGYEPHPVSMTFENRYGVCRDKAALLTAMLRLANIPAYPVLIHAGAKMDPDVPLPYFNHAITAVDKPGGGYLLMDPTDESARELFPAYLCNRSFLVARPEGETLLVSDVYPADKNMMRIDTRGTLDNSGTLLIHTKFLFEGINDNVYRGYLTRQKVEQRRLLFEGLIKRCLAGAEVIECKIQPEDLQDTDTPLSAELAIRVTDYPVQGTQVSQLALPWLNSVFGYVNFIVRQTGLKERKYMLDVGSACGVEESIDLDVSKLLDTPRLLPDDVVVERAGVRFTLSHRYDAGSIKGKLLSTVETPEFAPSLYPDLKKGLAEIEEALRETPLFVAQTSDQHDVEILESATETTLLSAEEWVTTNTMVKRVLTYAGKKRHAELKYNYNPAWQSIEVVSAVVSNSNGIVQEISPAEMNVMDAPWSGQAPRYAAAKTLVLNLPGVETGSVISVVTRFNQVGKRFYSKRHTFGATEPLLRERFVLDMPLELGVAQQLCHGEGVTTSVSTNQNRIIKEWHYSQPHAVKHEDNLPPWHLFQPTLYLSTGKWKTHAAEVQQWVKQVSGTQKNSRNLARMLVKDIKEPVEQLRTIRNYVLRTIRPVQLSFLDLPFDQLSTPDQTLADQYGHPMDRAILLTTMLKAVGFKPMIVMAGEDATGYEPVIKPAIETPQRSFFRFPLVQVKCQKKLYYVNHGDQYDELGSCALDGAVALAPNGKQLQIAVAEEFRTRSQSTMLVNITSTGDALVSITNWYWGTKAGPVRKLYSELLPENRFRHHLSLLNSLAKSAEPTSELEATIETYPPWVTFSAKIPQYATLKDHTLTLSLPQLAERVFPLRADKRENPLFLQKQDPDELVCMITLPEGYDSTLLQPPAYSWQLPAGSGTFQYTVEESCNSDAPLVLTIKRKLERNSAEFMPELYPALLEYNRLATHPASTLLIAEQHKSDNNTKKEKQ